MNDYVKGIVQFRNLYNNAVFTCVNNYLRSMSISNVYM